MIDWHSHILPCLDDGSGSFDESLRMLDTLSDQGVARVIATPRFYANKESLDIFLERREASFSLLAQGRHEACPRVLCGAEVWLLPRCF